MILMYLTLAAGLLIALGAAATAVTRTLARRDTDPDDGAAVVGCGRRHVVDDAGGHKAVVRLDLAGLPDATPGEPGVLKTIAHGVADEVRAMPATGRHRELRGKLADLNARRTEAVARGDRL